MVPPEVYGPRSRRPAGRALDGREEGGGPVAGFAKRVQRRTGEAPALTGRATVPRRGPAPAAEHSGGSDGTRTNGANGEAAGDPWLAVRLPIYRRLLALFCRADAVRRLYQPE